MIKNINSGRIRSLNGILNIWPDILDKYIRYNESQDNPWWYNERSTLSTLAAAGWACNGIAIEEFSTVKGKKDDFWKGRCDLFLGLKNEQFACEAKQAWCPIGRNAKNSFINVNDGLNFACNDARELDKQEGRRLGLCFAVPYLPPRDENFINQLITGWVDVMIKNIDCDAYSFIFPKQVRLLTNDNGYFFPGVALFIKEVFRQV
jgi:hypothetical protein